MTLTALLKEAAADALATDRDTQADYTRAVRRHIASYGASSTEAVEFGGERTDGRHEERSPNEK